MGLGRVVLAYSLGGLAFQFGSASEGGLLIDEVCFIQSHGRFHLHVIECVTGTADRVDDPGLAQCFGERDGRVLITCIRVMREIHCNET